MHRSIQNNTETMLYMGGGQGGVLAILVFVNSGGSLLKVLPVSLPTLNFQLTYQNI